MMMFSNSAKKAIDNIFDNRTDVLALIQGFQSAEKCYQYYYGLLKHKIIEAIFGIAAGNTRKFMLALHAINPYLSDN